MKHRLLMVLALALFGAACASTATKSSSAGARDQYVLTATEIEESGLPNAYELVSRRRRAWLRSDPVTGGAVTVYMDDRKVGGADALREIPAVTVYELRLVRNEDAIMRWSPDIAGSVIVVVPRR